VVAIQEEAEAKKAFVSSAQADASHKRVRDACIAYGFSNSAEAQR